jgi:hypothetical protein
LFETQDNAGRKEEYEEMEVHEKGRPCSGLMLGYGSDDWNVPIKNMIRDLQSCELVTDFLAYPVSHKE